MTRKTSGAYIQIIQNIAQDRADRPSSIERVDGRQSTNADLRR